MDALVPEVIDGRSKLLAAAERKSFSYGVGEA